MTSYFQRIYTYLDIFMMFFRRRKTIRQEKNHSTTQSQSMRFVPIKINEYELLGAN